MDIEVGQEFFGILGKLVIDPETNRLRVRTLEGQAVPEGLFIECAKKVRENSPLNTIFKVNVKVSVKPQGRKYLVSLRKQELLTVSEYSATYG